MNELYNPYFFDPPRASAAPPPYMQPPPAPMPVFVPMVVPQQHPQQIQRTQKTWWEFALLIVLAAAGGALVGCGIGWLIRNALDRDEPELKRILTPAERVALNRANGKEFEAMAATVLARMFPTAKIVPQLHVLTDEERARVVDFAILHRNGTMTAAEVKYVSQVTEANVRQTEDHRAGIRHREGRRSGPGLLVVPRHALVSDGHASRVRVVGI